MSRRNRPSASHVAIKNAGVDTRIPFLSPEEGQNIVVPVLREELEIHKAVNTTSVRIQKIIREVEEAISEPLVAETLDIERISIDRVVKRAPPVRTEGDVTVIPVVKEVLIVTKQLRLVEELRITRRRSVVDHQQTITLRAEELIVERQKSKD